MRPAELRESLALSPIIPAVRDDSFREALGAPSEFVFLLEANVMTAQERITEAHGAGKKVFVHLDLAQGIGRDRYGIEFLASAGADGVISTHASLIKGARETGMIAIQRYFAVDSQGLTSIREMIASARPDCIEIMPGVISKVISDFASERIPLIASGLIETKNEVTAALAAGAAAVSTGKKDLWAL